MKFGLVFVLYRPTEEYVENLLRLSAACPNAAAVDNSPEPDQQLHARLFERGVQVIVNCNQGGLAGAYNRGADALLACGCEAFFLLDQDSEIESSFFDKMVEGAAKLGTEEFLLGPKIYEVKLEKFMPLLTAGKYLPKIVPVEDKTAGLFPTLGVISSGSMVSAAAYRKIGPFNEDYFIEYLDGEYSMRARRAAVPIHLNASVTLRQSFGNIRRHGKWFSTNHAAWRRYYVARNCVHCFKTYREYVGLHWLSSIFVLQQLIMVLLFEAQKAGKLVALASGYVDGIRGRLGTFEQRHPRIAVFCGARAEPDYSKRNSDVACRFRRRRLSHTEHIVEGNIVYFVRVKGCIAVESLRSALNQVQAKHPALRVLLRQEQSVLYYDYDAAPEIPLRVVRRRDDDDYRHLCDLELWEHFRKDEPPFRATWLRGEQQQDLLFATSHRICDGASMLILVREILGAVSEPAGTSLDAAGHTARDRSAKTIAEPAWLIPYKPVTQRDLIADYQPRSAWKLRLMAGIVNFILRLIPEWRPRFQNREHFLEWRADRLLSERLTQRCRQEGVSVHAMFLAALARTLPAVFGDRVPKWIENPVDIRRGRFAALKDDMIFFGGGNFKIITRQAPDDGFWPRARVLNKEIRAKVEQELRTIPGQLYFLEMLRPVSRGQVQTIVRLGDAIKMNGSWNRFAFSNLGKVELSESEGPFQVTDLRIYMHSLNVRALCLVTYTFHGEMRFYCMGDEKCISPGQAETLQRRFMEILENAVAPSDMHSDRVAQVAAK
jgi:rhamnosyltransferase